MTIPHPDLLKAMMHAKIILKAGEVLRRESVGNVCENRNLRKEWKRRPHP